MEITQADKIYELRFYAVAPGRGPDMEDRVQNELKWLLPRHGIVPSAGWIVTSGPGTPSFIYLMKFSSMLHRDKCWRGFYNDPSWQDVRNRTNAGSELVEHYEIWFVREIVGWNGNAPDGGLDELLVMRTRVGKSAQAASALRESELPDYENAGAAILAAFDIVSGGSMPGSVVMLRWPDWQTRADGLAAMARAKDRTGRRSAETEEFGGPLLERTTSYMMDEVPIDWDAPAKG
ncbi:NIPSNAP family protein [Pacificimonas sp. ICDLI1SI03]